MRLNLLHLAALALSVSGCFSCRQPTPADPKRPEVDAVLLAMDSMQASGMLSVTEFHRVDSVLESYGPLRRSELLSKYDAYHWYYAEYLFNQVEKANAISDSALSLIAENGLLPGDSALYQKWLLNKGDDLVKLKRLNEAFRYYYEVMRTGSISDACQTYRIASRLGNVRFMQHDYRNAIRYYKQAFAMNRRCRQNNRITDYYQCVTEPQGKLNGIGLFFEHDRQLDSALHYYRRALDFLERESASFPAHKKEKQVALGVIYGNMGGLLAKMGRYTEAEKLLRKSIAINGQPSFDNRDALTAQLKLASLLTQTNRLTEASDLLRKLKLLTDSIPNDEAIAELKRTEWMLKNKRRANDAYQAFEEYHRFRDSLVENQFKTVNADFEAAFENMAQAQALANLALKNKQNFISLLVAITILVMLSAIIFLVYSNWRRSQQHIKHLRQLNERVRERSEKLQLTLHALQESQQENTRIIAMVAHDLKGSIGSVKIGTDFLLLNEQVNPEKLTKMAEIINRGAKQALLLIEDLVQSNAHDTSDHKDLINIETMIQDCAAVLKPQAASKDQTLELVLVPVHFLCNGEKLWRIISNLVINAIKFTPRNGNIRISLCRDDSDMIIVVADNGIGIPKDLQERLFEVGRGVGRAGTEGEPSTGLGLAIVKQIVASYQGSIEVESEEGQGTTFCLRFPLQSAG